MKSKFKKHEQNRRDFLVRGAFTMGAAASLAIATHADSTPIEQDTGNIAITGKAGNGGYRLTPHIREYYTKARF